MRRLLIALLLMAGCASAPQTVLTHEPAIGDILPIAESRRSMEFVVASASQMWPSYRVSFRGIDYEAGVDEMHRIRFVDTRDPRFATREGLRIGSTLADVLAAGGREPTYELGWGRYSVLQSGWIAWFDLPEKEALISGTTQVRAYFRRQGLGLDQPRPH